MKPPVIRFNRCCLFLALSLFLICVPLALSGCGGGSSSGTTVRTYVAGSFPFGDAIDSHGNIWVANQGGNVMELSPSGAIINTCVAGSVPIGIAIDSAGNVWVENYGNGKTGIANGDSNVTELSPACAKIGTYATGSFPAGGIAIDSAGNVWVTNWGAASGIAGIPGIANGDSNVTELVGPSPAATPCSNAVTTDCTNTYVAGSSPGGIAIDKSGNIWVANKGNGTPGIANVLDSNVTELVGPSPTATPCSGTVTTDCTNTYVAGSHPEGLAIDPAGNIWVVNKGNGTAGTDPLDSNVTELVGPSPTATSCSGTVTTDCTNTYVAGSLPETVAIDSAGNAWVANGYNRGFGTSLTNSSVTELSSSGAVIHTYAATGYQPYSIAIDSSGNVWVTNYGNGTAGIANGDSNVQEYMGAAKGPQYFPYSGPQWPGAE